MLTWKSALLAGTASLALALPALAQDRATTSERPFAGPSLAACNDIHSDLKAELDNITAQGAWRTRVNALLRSAEQTDSLSQCLDLTRLANRIIGQETGEAPIGSARFRAAERDVVAEARRYQQSQAGQQGGAQGQQRSAQQREAQQRQSQQRQEGQRPARQSEARGVEDGGSALVAPDFQRIPVAFADTIVGAMVTDRSGARAGEIEFLVVDTTTGAIRFAMIGSGGMLDLGDGLAAVPWEQVQARVANGRLDVRIEGTANDIQQSQRLDRQALDRLTSASFQTQVINYWLPIGGDKASGRDTGSAGQQQSGATGGMTQGQPSAGGQRAPGQAQARPGRERQADGGAVGAQGETAARGDDTTLLLAGRQFVTVLVPPGLATGEQLKGAEVQSRDGQQLGQIDRLVVDLDRGHIAYALVSEGGFLGIGEEWRPVPVTAMQWRSGETYVLSQSADELRTRPRLTSGDLPARIRAADLGDLYQAYEVSPYWSPTGARDVGRQSEAATGAGSGSAREAIRAGRDRTVGRDEIGGQGAMQRGLGQQPGQQTPGGSDTRR